MRNQLKKILTIFVLSIFLAGNVLPLNVYALEAPEAPSAPSAPTPPSAPEAPSAPSAPTPPPQPTPPPAPGSETTEQTEPTPSPTPKPESSQSPNPTPTPNPSAKKPAEPQISSLYSTPSPSPSTVPISTAGQQTGDQVQNSQLGGATIATGDATNNAGILTAGNNNLSAVAGGSSSDGASIVNSGNGVDSTNNGSASIVNNNSTTQDNSLSLTNNLGQVTNTGDNSTSRNTGGDNVITTGDANTTGTIINSLNTNVAGLMVSEFNVVDDQIGDIVLDFNANCISGCLGGPTTIKNVDNGDSSTNNGNVDIASSNTTFQNNDASIENNMVLASNSGDNKANSNTGGNNTIATGDANVSANVLTLANNNIAGNVIYGAVNIFGDLVGDIILSEDMLLSLCGSTCTNGSLTALNSGNGADSTNNINLSQVNDNELYQFNKANIDNNLILSAKTGDNEVSRNTDGNNSIATGNTSIEAQVVNIANSNLSGGLWWLVIVNEGGRWIGRILGADGSNFAGSSGTEFTVGENGEITAVNSGNGADSTNNITYSQTSNNTTTQINNMNLVNNIDLSANTGSNKAIRNTGGSSSITTGDANIVANLVNFVNNNISGGKLVVTMVNVFGSWFGDFVGPGQTKQVKANGTQDPAQGGPNNNPSGSLPNNSQDNNQEEGSGQATNANTSAGGSPHVSTVGHQNPSSGTSSFGSSSGAGEVSVAGFKTHVGDQVIGLVGGEKSKLRINLAWVLLLIPPLLVFGIFKSRRTILKKLPQNLPRF